ncbi:MAG TPA: c-type cytochrome [Terriglobia bacterium]|nr:c-type cytochrome [Terriglobia bacterium]
MNKSKWKDAIFASALLVSACGLVIAAKLLGQADSPQSRAGAAKTAGEAFKNIQVLKNIPANQLFPTMQFIASSLDVRCDFCHVRGDFASDAKHPKLIARKMIQMEFAIDHANFGDRKEVTCYTCHRGSSHPVGVPVIGEVAMNSPPEGGMNGGMNPSAPSADEIVSKFTQALGDVTALEKINTRVEKGTVTALGRHFPITVYAQAPDARVSIMQTPRGESTTGFNGVVGWMTGGPGPPRMMTAEDLAAERLNAAFDLALDLKQLYPQLREARPEKIDGKTDYVVLGLKPGQAPVKLYFDSESGLLVRTETFSETALGANPTEVDYADYREVNGIKVPFRWTIARPGGSFTIQVNSIQQNIPIEKSKFAAPAVAARGAPPGN